MSDAIRNVTIVLNVQPGDMSAIQAAKKELEEMRGITDGIGASTAKITAETESLAKATIEAVKQDREMLTLANDRTTVEEQASAKRTEIRKRELEAETKLETQAVEQIERIRRPLRDNLPTIGTSKSVTGEEASKIAEANAKKNEDIEVQRREKEHQLEMDAIDRKNAEELKKHQEKMKKEEEAEEQARQAAMQKKNQEMAKGIGELLKEIAKREEAEQKAQDKKEEAAEKTLQKIRTSELRNIREREAEEAQAEEEKREKAERTFRQIRMSELKGVREREAEEAEQEERKIENAQKMLQKIRVSELRNIREREAEEEAEREKKVVAADKMFKKIKEAEKKHARETKEEAEEAQGEMPKYWRNVGLNAGQAVGSVGRFISHMRLLKEIGGESLEDVAKKFLTIQSRMETITASTSFFTNSGTLVSGLIEAGEATEKIVKQQQILGVATTATQSATMQLGETAASIAPLIAPIQFGFTAIVAGIVAADIAMDFFGEKLVDAKDLAAKFDGELAKSVTKIREENQLITDQTSMLNTQWELRKLMAGDNGLTTSDLKRKQEAERKQNELKAQEDLTGKAKEIFNEGLTEEKKAERQKVEDELAKNKEIVKNPEGQFYWWDKLLGVAANETPELVEKSKQKIKELEIQKKRLEIEAESGISTEIKFEDGRLKDLETTMKEADLLPEDQRKKWLSTIGSELASSGSQLAKQQSEAKQKELDEKNRVRIEKEKVEKSKTGLQEEENIASVYGLERSKYRLRDTDDYLKDFKGATSNDQKLDAINRIKTSLDGGQGAPSLMTKELQAELDKGTIASPTKISELIKDASVVDDTERKAYEDAIAKAEKALTTAQNQAEATSRLIESVNQLVKDNEQQLSKLMRAIENRDLN